MCAVESTFGCRLPQEVQAAAFRASAGAALAHPGARPLAHPDSADPVLSSP
jgi:hypothetical protein